ncbi:uncharacterized protein LOC135639186 [Musa acuminata AAA Group]|uniref:uncharacterized protein LOC135639186 n=1 Tax=Musa acuminata AAA Group TaxID=214697 RepID=UPI0031E0BE62
MEFFEGASTVRLRSIHNTYLVADEYSQHVRLDRDGSCSGARWTVEIFTYIGDRRRLRLRSFYGRYLAAHRTETAFLNLTGKKVFQEAPLCFGPRVNWLPLRDGCRVRLKCVFDQFLRAKASVGRRITRDAGVPLHPILDSVGRRITRDAGTPAGLPGSHMRRCLLLLLHSGQRRSCCLLHRTHSILLLGSWMFSTAIYRVTIQYKVADDAGNVDESSGRRTLTFAAGGSIGMLKRRLQEETGLVNIYVCGRSPTDGSLVPINLPPPPDCPHTQVVVVKANSTAARNLKNRYEQR